MDRITVGDDRDLTYRYGNRKLKVLVMSVLFSC